MINELYTLSKALAGANIETYQWHQKYKPIPNIRANAPCICITLSDGKVSKISMLNAKFGKILRKYGSNQGSFPCMNLASLYRITDDTIKKNIAGIMSHPETLDAAMLQKVKGWCTENNWSKKFRGKYKISMDNIPAQLRKIAPEYAPLQALLAEVEEYKNPDVFHAELENAIWRMLERRENVQAALTLLFYLGKPAEDAEDDFGSLSIALESTSLIESGIPAISEKFVTGMNQCLLNAEAAQQPSGQTDTIDAFGIPFMADETPMPSVKLAGGFDATIRTMFKEQRCQTRYGRIDSASYPISPEMRGKLQAALAWIGDREREDKTWTKSDQNEILFVYPLAVPDHNISYISPFKRVRNETIQFTTKAEQFTQQLRKTRKPGTDSHAEGIQIFVLHKIDKARTKVVYTRQTDPDELEQASEAWTLGCTNLPKFPFGAPEVPYPLDIADILNQRWKRNGDKSADKFKLIPRYHGMELLMEPAMLVCSDFHLLAENAVTLSAHLGYLSATEYGGNSKWNDVKNILDTHNSEVEDDGSNSRWNDAKNILALMGLFLYRNGIRKDDYMDNLPYLYGQLLKAADELHALYCKIVRNNDYPKQFAGGSLFLSAVEAPIRTLNILSQRIMPYYTWAKSYRLQGIQIEGKESWRAGWLYRLCEDITEKIKQNWTMQTRLNEEEKAQMFIGYLAAFPKSEKNETKTEEDTVNEQ